MKNKLEMNLDIILIDLLQDKYFRELEALKDIIVTDPTIKDKDQEFKRLNLTFDNWLIKCGYATKQSTIIKTSEFNNLLNPNTNGPQKH